MKITPRCSNPKHPAQLIAEFHRAFGVPTGGSWRYALRARLIDEEAREAYQAFHRAQDNPTRENLAQCLKECADVAVVAFGALVETIGTEGAIEAFRRVHASNMSKLDDEGRPVLRDDGKLLKGPNYVAPNLKDLLPGIPENPVAKP